jgi:hypothetical protein
MNTATYSQTDSGVYQESVQWVPYRDEGANAPELHVFGMHRPDEIHRSGSVRKARFMFSGGYPTTAGTTARVGRTNLREHLTTDYKKTEALHNWVENSVWRRPCEDMFNQLALDNTGLLCDLILNLGMHDADIADAAFALEASPPSNMTVNIVLVGLLNHEKPYVREAAVHGLSNKQSIPFVFSELKKAIENEKIQEIKDDILEVISSKKVT